MYGWCAVMTTCQPYSSPTPRVRGRYLRKMGSREEDDHGYPTFTHNQWTIEGELERVGAFARGASRATGRQRTMAVILAFLLILPFAVGIVMSIVTLFGN